MKQRDYISEIKEIKSRLEDKSWEGLKFDLETLECALDENRVFQKETLNNEFNKYIPIRMISCFETFFRLIAKSLIDHDEKYKSNCKKFKNQNIRFEFDTILAIESQKISIGDLISHLLPFNNFGDINTNISIILDKDFLKELKSFKRPIKNEFDEEDHLYWNKNFDKIIRSVENTFELRHIFCHEFGAKMDLNKEEAQGLLKDCRAFIDQADEYFAYMFFGEQPDSGEEWIEYSKEQFGNASNNLNKVIEVYKNELTDERLDFSKLDMALEKWYQFRDLFAEFNVSPYKGGEEVYNVFLSANKAGITQRFMETLILNLESIKKTTANNV